MLVTILLTEINKHSNMKNLALSIGSDFPDFSKKCNASADAIRIVVSDDFYGSKERWYYSRILFSPDRFMRAV